MSDVWAVGTAANSLLMFSGRNRLQHSSNIPLPPTCVGTAFFFFAFRLYQTSFSVFFLSFVAEVCLLFSFICIQFLLLSTFELIMDTTNTHKNTHAHPLAATRLTLYWQEISVYFHLNKFTTNAMFLQNTMDTTVWLWRWKLKNSCCFFFLKRWSDL